MFVFVCYDSVTSDIGSTTNTNCSPRWIVHPRSVGYHADGNGATTQQECLDACVANANCRTAEWNYATDLAPGTIRCWIHEREPSSQHREPHPDIVLFDIARACFTTSGTCSLHQLYCRPATFYC